MPSRRPILVTLIAAPLAFAALTACFTGKPAGVTSSLVAEDAPAISLSGLQPNEKLLVKLFRDASPSVVFITNRGVVRRRAGYFRYYEEEVDRGTGSGFIWDKNGHVVTNAHVIAGSSTVKVTFADQSVYDAEIVGIYEDKDVAVLKVKAPAEKLSPIKVGNSRDLLVGMTAIAIGNPFGLDHTMTVGIIGALGREIRAVNNRRISDVIQTDAAINPGNSGGPLLNSRGEIIGVNTAILSPSRTNSGIGFAVPIETVRRLTEQIIAGRIRRPGLGVEVWGDSMVRGFIRQNYGLPGVLLYDVPQGSAAAKAGLRKTTIYTNGERELGDLIVGINGQRINTGIDLQDATDRYKIGDEIEVHYVRNNKEYRTKLKLQEVVIKVSSGG